MSGAKLSEILRVIGFDPGLAATGWAVVEYSESLQTVRHIAHGVIKTSVDDVIQDRVSKFWRKVTDVIQEHQVHWNERPGKTLVCAESYQNYGRVFWNGVQTLYVMGALFTQAETLGYTTHLISAKDSKRLIGVTDGQKSTVQKVVQEILGLPKPPKPTHAADALCIALAHLEQIYPGSVVAGVIRLPGQRATKVRRTKQAA